MGGFTVDPVDLSCYNGYMPPSLKNTVLYVEAVDPRQAVELCQRVDAGHQLESTVHDPILGSKSEPYHRSSYGVTVDRPTYDWVYSRIEQVVQYHLAEQIVGEYKVVHMAEAVQFLRYVEAKQSRFRRHWDDAYHDAEGVFHFTSPQRKFTTITLLNEDYEGGLLVLDTVKDQEGKPFSIKPVTGSMIIFPSDQRFPHEVTPVTKGTRRSVVAWFDLER